MGIKTNSLGKRIAGLFLSSALAVSAFAGLGTFTAVNVQAAAEDYGLVDTCQEGVILHAWQWSFNNIKANMAKIAEAGYTSVQTSVIQQAKEGTKGKTNSVWWVYYQPANFTIDNTGNSALGTKAEFAAMCEEAHKYGIHVIVDVVANHLGNQSKYDISTAVPSDIRNDTNCWHSEGFTEINYNNRYSITHGSMGGLPDLNTENTKIQNYVKAYLRECIDCGADGFRFDATKHISVPSEGSQYTFWSNVIPDAKSYYQTKGTYDSLYCYGEILDGTNGPDISGYTKYMSITDNSTGNDIRAKVAGGNAAGAARSNYDQSAGASNSVLWAESHDTYSGDGKETTNVSESVINKTWALVASRNQATALYFARTAGYRTGNIGDIGSKQCFNKEVVEVNKFHNFFNGQSEYLASSGSIAYNERGTSGVVIVNVGGGSTSVNLTAHKMKDGTYKDQVTGNTFTVSGGIISGTVGSTGIAVVYNAVSLTEPSVSASPANNSGFTTDTLSVTLNCKNVASASYTTSEGASGTYTNGTKITVGSKTNVGSTITVNLTGTTSNKKTVTATYTYTKKNPAEKVMLYFENNGMNWKQVYAYIYDESGAATLQNAAWPGKAMTYNSSLKLYEIEVPDNLANGNVIFTETKDATTNRYPADMEPGLSIGGKSMLFERKTWTEYKPVSTSSVSASPATGTSFTDDTLSVTLNCKNVTSPKYTTSEGASGSYTDGTKITVGSKTAVGSSVTVTLTGTGSDGTAVTAKYTYTKKAPSEKVMVYFDNSKYNWKQVYAYIYDESVTPTVKNAAWPGKLMTFNSEYSLYEMEIPENLVNGRVIFTESSSATTNRYPADQKPGLAIGNTSKKFAYGNSWENFSIQKPEFTNNSTLASAKISLGNSVAINCKSAGGQGTVTYGIYYKKSSDAKWTTKQNFSANATASIKPAYATTYEVCVKAKDETGTILKKFLTLTVTANANTNLSNTSTISKTTIACDTNVTIKCASTGGTGTTYAVLYKKSTDSTWTTKQNFGTNTSVTIKPTSATLYKVCVKAKDNAGNIAKLYFDLTVTANAKSTLVNTSTISSTSVKKGTALTLKVSATGGKKPYTYAVYIKKTTDSAWTTKQNFATTSSVSVKFDTVATYDVCVKVKDSTGSIAKKYFKVKVS